MNFDALLKQINLIHTSAQEEAGRALNQILSLRSWMIGAWIVEYEQGVEERAVYGARLLHQ